MESSATRWGSSTIYTLKGFMIRKMAWKDEDVGMIAAGKFFLILSKWLAAPPGGGEEMLLPEDYCAINMINVNAPSELSLGQISNL
jgi:hypothetical protein